MDTRGDGSGRSNGYLEVVKARRTRGHVLQLHGFLDAARVDLRAALRTISEVSAENEPWHAEDGDVLLCCSSAEVAAESPYTDGRDLVRRALAQEPNTELLPGLLRNQLQFASIDEVALRQRRRPLAKQKSEPYEAALDETGRNPDDRCAVGTLRDLGLNRCSSTESRRYGGYSRGDREHRTRERQRSPESDPPPYAAPRRGRRLRGLRDVRDLKRPTIERPLRRADLIPRQASTSSKTRLRPSFWPFVSRSLWKGLVADRATRRLLFGRRHR